MSLSWLLLPVWTNRRLRNGEPCRIISFSTKSYKSVLNDYRESPITSGGIIICHLAGDICRKWRNILCHRTSDGIHISLQTAQSLPPDPSRPVAKGVPSPARKSGSASTRHASRVRFASPAFPLLFAISLPLRRCRSASVTSRHLTIHSPYCMRLLYADMAYVKNTFCADAFFSVCFSACVIGYEEKTANDKIQKAREQTEAQPDGA